MITDSKKFFSGLILLLGFLAVLVVIFMPLFDGRNALNYMDDLYNSISKGSAYYIPELREECKQFEGREISVTLALETEEQARETAPLFEAGGAATSLAGKALTVTGDLGGILTCCLDDSNNMFENNGAKVGAKYGYGEKQALYNWWLALKLTDKDLKKQNKFPEAKFIGSVLKKGVECSYNYYGVEPQKISAKILIVLFSLVFYVVYTIWYGFSIMFMFEGCGLKLGH